MPKAVEFHCEGKESAYTSIIMTLQAELVRLRLIRTYALQSIGVLRASQIEIRVGAVYGRLIIAT